MGGYNSLQHFKAFQTNYFHLVIYLHHLQISISIRGGLKYPHLQLIHLNKVTISLNILGPKINQYQIQFKKVYCNYKKDSKNRSSQTHPNTL